MVPGGPLVADPDTVVRRVAVAISHNQAEPSRSATSGRRGQTNALSPVIARPTTGNATGPSEDGPGTGPAGGMGRRRVLVHSSGFQMSPYADIKPLGEDAKTAPRRARVGLALRDTSQAVALLLGRARVTSERRDREGSTAAPIT
jgi:error-prone DNA polymerase